MECFHRRIPYASWRLQVFRRLFKPSSGSNGSTTSPHREVSTSNSPRQQNTLDDNEASLRPSQLLPQSPLAKQSNEKKRKRKPTHEDLHELSRNPWAVALASPLRMCTVTRTRVPAAFMSQWGMLQRLDDPEKLWLMPVGLLKEELSLRKTKEAQQARQTTAPSHDNQALHSLKLRIIDRLPLLKHLNTPFARATGGKKSAISKLIPHRWKPPFGPMTVREERMMVWRQDMPSFVLGQMRKDVMRKLKRAIHADQEGDTTRRVWSVVEVTGQSGEDLTAALNNVEAIEGMGSGAVLVLGRQADAPRFPSYVTLPQVKSKVPVFDLSVLLPDSDVEQLRDLDPRFRGTALFFKADDSVTVDALLALWKLQGFIRHDEQHG